LQTTDPVSTDEAAVRSGLERLAGRNIVVAFEGCDGAGKTTIRLGMRDELLRLGIASMAIGMHSWLHPASARIIANAREHRHQHTTEEIREAYFQDRRAHIAGSVVPALRRAWVIADRYFYSDAVYQEVLYGIPAGKTLERHLRSGSRPPDVVVHVDLDGREAYDRVVKRGRTTRHYERVPELTEIVRVYRRVFYTDPPPEMPPVVRFVNSSPDWLHRLRHELLPAVLQAAASAAPATPGVLEVDAIASMPINYREPERRNHD
jgi:dTMP kinase